MSSTRQDLGVWAQFGLAAAWPELAASLNRLYTDRVAKLPWVPRDWFVQVMNLQAANPGSLIVIGPALNVLGGRSSDAPTFADSDDKLHAWQEIFQMTEAAIRKYADGKASEGRAEMDAAYMNSDFWNRAYAIAVAIRDLPANAVGAVLSGAESVTGGILGSLAKSWLFWAALIGAGVVIAWRFGLLRGRK